MPKERERFDGEVKKIYLSFPKAIMEYLEDEAIKNYGEIEGNVSRVIRDIIKSEGPNLLEQMAKIEESADSKAINIVIEKKHISEILNALFLKGCGINAPDTTRTLILQKLLREGYGK